MTHPRHRAARSIGRYRPALILITLVLVLASCSKGSDDAVTAKDKATTTTTTSTTTTAPKALTKQDLTDALLTAEEVGAGFKVDESDQSDDSGPDVPPACKALFNEGDDPVHVERVLTDDAKRELDVDASVTTDTVAGIEEASKSCKEIPFTEDDVKGVIKVTITPNDTVGDDAVNGEFEFAVTAPIVVNFKAHGVLAKRGGVGFSVLGTDAVDDNGNVIAFDQALIDKAATQLDQKVKDAQA
jgi:hypothetical protein